MDDLTGRSFGKHVLLERIGRGGMAEVYKAHQPSLDRYVAVKIMHPFLSDDPEFKSRFEREARNVAKLRHPNIVQVYDFDLQPGLNLYYMVMEYIDGPTLRTLLVNLAARGERLPVEESVRIAHDIALALTYAHERDMIHRDIKPANIMLDADKRVVLTDFGIAKIVSVPTITSSGSLVGTPAYMAPEQGLGQVGDHRADIYSLGAVLYQMVAGELPYNSDTPIGIVLKHVNDPLPPPSIYNADIPDPLERIIFKAMAKDPDDRYQTGTEMAEHLSDLSAASRLSLPPTLLKHRIETGAITPDEAGVEAVLQPEARPPVALPRKEEKEKEKKRQRGCLRPATLLLALLILAIAGGALLTGLLPPTAYTALGNVLPPDTYQSLMLLVTQTSSSVRVPSLAVLTPAPMLSPSGPAAGQPAAVSSATPDLLPTQLQETIEALSAALATPSPPPTPDLTATVEACDYDYEIVSQHPLNGTAYPQLTTMTKTITILNDSKCAWDDDTRLVFAEGAQLEGPDVLEFNHVVAPGEEFTVELELRTPKYDPLDYDLTSTWNLELPDGYQIGPPLTFEVIVYAGGG
jgi:serine/threonine protein kinase